MISAMVPMVTPATEIAEMMLMMLWLFLETRYRRAM
jgi:hypothetical protein